MKSKLLYLLVLLFAVSCYTEPVGKSSDDGQNLTARKKIVNTSKNADTNSIIVYFDDAAIEQIESNVALVTRSGGVATRSGVVDVDNILERINVVKMRRVFVLNPKSEDRIRERGMHRWYVLEFDTDIDIDAVASELSAVAEISKVQFNTRLRKVATQQRAVPMSSAPVIASQTRAARFDDPNLIRQWHYQNYGEKSITTAININADINAEAAWAVHAGSDDIVVAVIDEGVKWSHPDLAANMWKNTAELNGSAGVDDDGNGFVDDIYGHNFAVDGPVSWDVTGGSYQGNDTSDTGHGTHVAGTISAVNNNGVGVSGVAGGSGAGDGVKIMSCQIFSGDSYYGGGGTDETVAAIRYAADMGASIISCSFGWAAGDVRSDNAFINTAGAEKDAYDYFISTQNNPAVSGGIAIFAAGNDTTPMSGYPGAYRDYISVTAFGPDYLPAYYTNYGPGSNIAAPGGEYGLPGGSGGANPLATVLSTLPSEINDGEHYGYMQGTSMATPHVSGVAALGLSYAAQLGKTFTLDEFKAMLLTSVNSIEDGLKGTKWNPEAGSYFNLSDYRNMMGTGAVDAFQLLMQIEGTPCVKITAGLENSVALTPYFGEAAGDLTYYSITVSDADKSKIGLVEDPKMLYGKLVLKPTKPGVATIAVTAIAGGDNLGTSTTMGGMRITKEFAVVVRGANNTSGGWL